MTLSFPRPMPVVGVMQTSFEIQRNDYTAPTGTRTYAVAAGEMLWLARLTFNNMFGLDAGIVRSWVDAQRGPSRTFIAWDIDRAIPFHHQGGRPFQASPSGWSQTISDDGVAYLALEGLHPGQVVTVNDYVGFIWSTNKLALVRAAETAIADASGNATFAVEPPVPTRVVPLNAAVNLKQASCLMRLTTNTKLAEQGIDSTLSGGLIEGLQDLIA